MNRVWIAALALLVVGAVGAGAASCDHEPGGNVGGDAGLSDGGIPLDGGRGNGNLHVIALDDDTDQPVPARVDFTGLDGVARPLIFSNDVAGVPLGRDTAGMFGSIALLTGDGEARVTPGKYDLTVQRGIEFDVVTQRVDIPASGVLDVTARMPRAFQTPGWIGGDFHVHQAPSNDSDVPAQDRVVSLVIEGIELVSAADHNENFDLAGATRELRMEKWLFSISGNEVSIDLGHFNVFPVAFDAALPHGGSPSVNLGWDMATMLRTFKMPPEDELVQINHPRLISPLSYFDAVGWDPATGGVARPPFILDGVDSVEILNGIEAKREDIEKILVDWLALMERGHVLTAMGNSDTHRIISAKGGSPRSYLRVPDDRPMMMTMEAVRQAIRGHHVIATSGPWLDVAINDAGGPGDTVTVPAGNDVRLSIEIAAANFVPVDRIRIFANGVLAQTRMVPSSLNHVRFKETIVIPRPTADTFYVVVADANTPLPRELAGRIDRDTFSYAIANPIFVDVDGLAPFAFPRPRLPANLTSGHERPDITPLPWWRDLDHSSVIEFDDCENEGLEANTP